MKVALCLSGLARSVEECYPSIYKTLIQPYSTDVYIHTWRIGLQQADIDRIIELYKPTRYSIDESHVAIRDYSKIPYNWGTRQVYNMYSMFDSIHRCNTLIENRYDVVIRCRFDLHFTEPILLEQYDMSKIHTKHQGHYLYNDIHDQFAFSSQENMNYYSNCFLRAWDTYNSIHDVPREIRSPEIILGHYLRASMNVETHPFSFDILRS